MTWERYEDYLSYKQTTLNMSKSHFGAYRAGVQARTDGKGRETCPYRDKGYGDGRSKTPRAYMYAWIAGWDDKDKEQP